MLDDFFKDLVGFQWDVSVILTGFYGDLYTFTMGLSWVLLQIMALYRD